MPARHPEWDLVSEAPTELGGRTWTARRNEGEARWQVFLDEGFGPAGYLEAVYQPTEATGNGGWQIRVFDRRCSPIGELSKRAAPGTVPAVNSYQQALAWLDYRDRGIA